MHCGGYFGVIHALDICKHDGGAEICGERVEAMLDGMFEFVGFGLLVWRHVGVGEPPGRIHLFAVAGFRLERGGGTPLLSAEFVVAGVGDGAHEPGFKGAAAKGCDAAKGGDEGFLCGVFRPVFVAEDAQGCVEDGILIMQDERIERIEIAFLRGLDESGFVHGFI